MRRKLRVRMEVAVDVTLPVDLPLGAVNKYGVVIDAATRQQAVDSAIHRMAEGAGKVDVLDVTEA